jgi:N-methylhydantoinase B/oxoprolinase/acetone carboxylase alpha subunit
MIGCVDLGVARITEIIKKYGSEVFTRTCENLMDYAERRMRAELASFPDGKYGFQDVIENDGIEARPYTVAIDIYVQGDEVVADYSRSSPQAKGPIDHDEYFACYDLMSGAWGGRFGHDGNDCVIAINGNCRFNPTEVFETRFPLLVEDCAMITDSGGAGRWRGGLGYTRTLKIPSVPITGSRCSDRHEVRPFALFGGQEGGNGGTQIQKAGSDEWLTVRELYGKVSSSKYGNAQFQPGDRIRL